MIDRRKKTIYENFAQCAVTHSGDVALIYQHVSFTYQHVLDRVNKIAFALTKLGYQKNDVITVMLPNIPMAVYLLYAINQIGAVANLVHPLMKETQLTEIMEKTKSKILFTLDSNVVNLVELKGIGIKIYATSPVDELNPFIRLFYRLKNPNKIEVSHAHSLLGKDKLTTFDNNYTKDSFYLHSGGTTGQPKTIALSSYALNAIAVSGLTILDEKKYPGGMLSVLPMFHGFGLCMGTHASLINGGYNVLLPKFHSSAVIKYLKKDQLQTLIGVPILYEALLRNPKFKGKILKKINNAFVGGDFVNETLFTRFNQRMVEGGARARLYEGYGLTETVTVCAVNTHRLNKERTVGKALPFVEVKAFKNNKALPPNNLGELYVKGATLMNGYRFEDKKINPFYLDSKDNKWVKTGDYGKVDKNGFVYFVQRIKRIIKVNGINVFPKEIENEIMKLPYVFECYAKGVKDQKRGNMIDLFVVLDRKAKKENYDEELKEVIKNKFGVYALPKMIKYMKRLPKTLVGKVDEKELNAR